MSIELPEKIQARKRDARITIVTSAYNAKYVQAMRDNCVNELAEAYPTPSSRCWRFREHMKSR